MNIDDILEHLPKLTRSELEEVEQRILLLKTLTKSNRIKLITIHEDFYHVLDKYLYSEKGIRIPPFNTFQSGKMYDTYDTSMKIVEDFTKTHFVGINQIEKMKLYHIYCRIVCSEVEGFTGTTSLNIIYSYLGKVPELFNKAFPNYIKSGLAKAVLKF